MDQIVTNLAVMDFDAQTGAMRLVSLHPGVTLEEVQDNTGFDLIVPEAVPTTAAPTVEEIALLRTKIDPQAVRKLGMWDLRLAKTVPHPLLPLLITPHEEKRG